MTVFLVLRRLAVALWPALVGAQAPAAVAPRGAPRGPQRLLDTLQLPVRYARVFGQRMAYYEAGPSAAPVLILIPNWNWDARHAWAQNVPELARASRVIAVDPLGLGRSDKPLVDYQMGTWTDALAEFLRVRGIARATFAGPAMGGALAIQMALDYPERVAAVVVSATEDGPGAPRRRPCVAPASSRRWRRRGRVSC